MKLVIAEKPSVGKSIASVIGAVNKKDGYMEGNGYVVSWCIGHMAKLEEDTEKWELEKLPIIPSDKIVVKKETEEQFIIVKRLMERSDITSLVCATDAGREGEAIFRYVYCAANCMKPFERLWISSMTDEAISEGFANLQDGHNFDNLYQAAVARDKADSLVGISGTRLFSLKYGQYKPPLSVGRVQTPTLSMIVKREQDIRNFVKEKYFKVHIMAIIGGKPLEAVSEKISSLEEAQALVTSCDNALATVTSVEKENKSKSTPQLYDLTTLQRECSRMFGYTAQETLDIVQELYESKLCTYPRTDSKYLSDDMESAAKDVAEAIFESAPFVPSVIFNPQVSKVLNSKKVTDHHAIIPTGEVRSLDWSSLSEKKFNVLGLIATRMLAAMAMPYQYQSTKILLDCAGKTFKAVGNVETEEGYRGFERAFKKIRLTQKDDETEEQDEEKELPDVAENAQLNVQSQLSEHFTQPPKHYTEDTLLAAMETAGAEEVTEDIERKGLGTTATRAAIIENLIQKGYCERKKKQLLSTDRAEKLMFIIPEELKSPSMTAEMENTLSLVAKGQASAKKFLDDMVRYMKNIVEENKGKVVENNPFGSQGAANTLGTCPSCNKPVTSGKYGAWCTGKCGMNVSKVFGHQLTDNQVKDLLNGKKVTYKNGKYTNTVLSDIEPFSYTKDGKEVKGFQWKTEGKKN
ncbi:MAG: DNA topoisomerase 3 [Ruminococcus flavefaciens]|nr:DNA topoisomerase 3 [Ruminococcus flavefaciens]